MTLQEAKKQLEYIKIKVNNESEKVQKLLFKIEELKEIIKNIK